MGVRVNPNITKLETFNVCVCVGGGENKNMCVCGGEVRTKMCVWGGVRTRNVCVGG